MASRGRFDLPDLARLHVDGRGEVRTGHQDLIGCRIKGGIVEAAILDLDAVNDFILGAAAKATAATPTDNSKLAMEIAFTGSSLVRSGHQQTKS